MSISILNLSTFKPKTLSIIKTAVFHFLLLIILLGHLDARAAVSCKELFFKQNTNSGAQFLKQQEPNLHTAPFIDRVVKKNLSRLGNNLQKPIDRITAWIKYLESMYKYVQKHPQAALKIKNVFYNQYVIKPQKVPQSYFDLQIRIAREQGHGRMELTPEMRQQYIDTIIADQKSSLGIWIDYFMSKDTEMYPMWVKYWMLTGMTKLSTFDSEAFTFAKRSDETAAPFADLNREAIAYVVDVIVKKANGDSLEDIQSTELRSLLDNANFGKLYGFAIQRALSQQAPLTTTAGVWVKYPQGSDHMRLVKSLEGKGTGWCTAGESTAEHQLDSGDFYVYYSRDQAGDPTMPRIAIRMNGSQQIAEVRGIAKQQNMDPHIANTNILAKKLKEFGEQGLIYQKRSQHMKKLTLIENKNNKAEALTIDELRFLYELDESIEGFGYETDPRIKEILATRNKRLDVAFVLNLKPEQVSTTTEEALSGNILFHYGDLILNHLTSPEGLTFPQHVSGSLYLNKLKSAEGFILPVRVDGELRLDELTSAKGLTFTQHVGKTLALSNLKSVQGVIFPKYVGQSITLFGLTSAEGLTLPRNFKGDLYLDNVTSAKGLVIPSHFRGNLMLKNLTSAEGLVLPENFPGSLHLNGLKTAQGLVLPKSILGTLHLDNLTSAKGLVLPQHLGALSLNGLKAAQDLILPKRLEGILFLDSLTSAVGLILPEYVGSELRMNQLSSTNGLKLPQHVGGLYLNGLKSAQGLTLPKNITGFLNLYGLTSLDGLTLPNGFPIERLLVIDTLQEEYRNR